MTGTWRSEAAEAMPAQGGSTNYLVREFAFTGRTWRIHFTVYRDAAMTTPVLSGDNSGDYVIESGHSDSGNPAEFRFSERTLTPLSRDAADALTHAGCGTHAWTMGEKQSVLEKGCAPFRVFPLSQCDREYDRVALLGSRLFLGARPNDGFMCAPNRRPEAVSKDALLRVTTAKGP